MVMNAIDRLSVNIQGRKILRSMTLDVAAGELVCFVSRNGAGKTTTFRTNMGFLKPVSGTLQFVRQPLTGMDTHRIACARIHDPQLLLLDEPFESLSPAIIPGISSGIASIRKLGHGVLMADSNAHDIPEYAYHG